MIQTTIAFFHHYFMGTSTFYLRHNAQDYTPGAQDFCYKWC